MCIQFCEFIFAVAIALQLSGALILVDYFWHRCKRENILREALSITPIFDGGEENENGRKFCLSVYELQRIAKSAFKNISAAIFIVSGYLLSIFGAVHDNKCCIVILIVILTILIIIITCVIIHMMAKVEFPDDCNVELGENNEIIEIDKKQRNRM